MVFRGSVATALVILVCCSQAAANPVPLSVPDEVRQSVEAVLSQDSANADSLFVEMIARASERYFEGEAGEILGSEFGRLAPLMAESQGPRHAMNDKIQNWYWGRAGAEQREMMNASLRRWLQEPFREEELPDTTDEMLRPHRGWFPIFARVDAAELLVDRGDSLAFPLVASVRDSIRAMFGGLDGMSVVWIEAWWYLHQAALRASSPDRAVLCRQSGEGRIEILAEPSDIIGARYADFYVFKHPEMPVSHGVAVRAVRLAEESQLVGRCRERQRAPCSKHGSGLLIQMSDGRELSLTREPDGTVLCSDNTRRYRWAHRLSSPELEVLLNDIKRAFVAEESGYPSAGSTGMPN
jgi:hypothetical protein